MENLSKPVLEHMPLAVFNRFKRLPVVMRALARRMCMGPWKEPWDTDPTDIVLPGSSMSVLHLKMDQG